MFWRSFLSSVLEVSPLGRVAADLTIVRCAVSSDGEEFVRHFAADAVVGVLNHHLSLKPQTGQLNLSERCVHWWAWQHAARREVAIPKWSEVSGERTAMDIVSWKSTERARINTAIVVAPFTGESFETDIDCRLRSLLDGMCTLPVVLVGLLPASLVLEGSSSYSLQRAWANFARQLPDLATRYPQLYAADLCSQLHCLTGSSLHILVKAQSAVLYKRRTLLSGEHLSAEAQLAAQDIFVRCAAGRHIWETDAWDRFYSIVYGRKMRPEDWQTLMFALRNSVPQNLFEDGGLTRQGFEHWLLSLLKSMRTDVCWSFFRAFGFDGALEMKR